MEIDPNKVIKSKPKLINDGCKMPVMDFTIAILGKIKKVAIRLKNKIINRR